MSKTILVFGVGQIGIAVIESLREKGFDVISVSKGSVGNKNQSGKHVQVEIGEYSKILNLISEYRPQRTIMALGISGIQKCKSNPIESLRVNVDASFKILELCASRGIESLVFSSSLIWDTKPIEKSLNTYVPRTIYGQHKLLLENKIANLFPPVSIVRLGKVIDSNSVIIKKIEDHLLRKFETIFYKNLFIAPVHLSSVIQATEKWIANEVKGLINLVPHYQMSESEIASAVLSQYQEELDSQCISELKLPDDELPKAAYCPTSVSNADFGIYGLEAVFQEIAR